VANVVAYAMMIPTAKNVAMANYCIKVLAESQTNQMQSLQTQTNQEL
jgi:hypothetical protein